MTTQPVKATLKSRSASEASGHCGQGGCGGAGVRASGMLPVCFRRHLEGWSATLAPSLTPSRFNWPASSWTTSDAGRLTSADSFSFCTEINTLPRLGFLAWRGVAWRRIRCSAVSRGAERQSGSGRRGASPQPRSHHHLLLS